MSLDRIHGASPRKWRPDEFATGVGGADLRLIVARGRTTPREMGSGLSGQASAFYRCSMRTPRLRDFLLCRTFIVPVGGLQDRAWAWPRAACACWARERTPRLRPGRLPSRRAAS